MREQLLSLREQTGAPSGLGGPFDETEDGSGLVTVTCGLHAEQLPLGNASVGEIRARFRDRFDIDPQSVAALKLDRVHLLGHSWGSMLGFEYYLTHKQNGVVSLISSGSFHSVPRWEADQQIHIANLAPEIQAIIRRNEADGTTASAEYKFVEQLYYKRHLCRTEPWPNAVKRTGATVGDVYSQMWGPTEFFCTGTLKGRDQTPRFREITVPTLFTAGEYDECRPETARSFQSMVPGAELMIFKGAAHHHHIDAAKDYLDVVREFLQRSEAKSLQIRGE